MLAVEITGLGFLAYSLSHLAPLLPLARFPTRIRVQCELQAD